ncbi:MAG: DUF1553 domain-containing protein [Gemmataceae bacterium]
MNISRSWAVLACALAALPCPAADRYAGADALARRIDDRLASAWKQAGVPPAADADDSEWLRRVYLDLAGRIPSVTEARAFLADRREDRRRLLVERLLGGPRFATHFATVWRNLLLPEGNVNFQVRFSLPGFEKWLRDWVVSGRGYDAMVTELLTTAIRPGGGALQIGGAPGPAPFYSAKEFKPEEIAGAVARTFLGVNLSCAQCHNHPFADWKREQFWSFAAFFSGIKVQRRGDFVTAEAEKADSHEIEIPGTDKVVKAKYLNGQQAEVAKGAKAREVLARWMTAKDNPYFARAIVNRMWAHFFGTGLVEPLDEMTGTESQPSHPALLDELAAGFVGHGHDLRWLMRAITSTKAYQLSSRRSHPGQDDGKLFAKMALRGLTPEQLYDSVAMATGFQEAARGGGFYDAGGARSEFLTKFANGADRPTETQTSILQALTLMNGRVVTSATDLKRSETLAAVIDAPFLDTAAKVEALYLAALTRTPTAKEVSRMAAYVEKGGTAQTGKKQERRAEALADVFWVLLNSGEFVLNH